MAASKENAARLGAGGAQGVIFLGSRIGHQNIPNEARLQCLAGRLHALGPRPTYEFLKEVAAGADLLDRLEVYARLDPDFIRAFGGDILPIDRMAVVEGGRP
jgi:hypothetical protein